MIIEDYVSFETAKLLKEKRFDCNTNCYYIEDSDTRTLFYSPIRENHNASIENNEFNIHINISSGKMSAPTLQMAMKWLREKHKITIGILFKGDRIYYEIHQNNEFVFGVDTPESYEKVCDEAIKFCLEILN